MNVYIVIGIITFQANSLQLPSLETKKCSRPFRIDDFLQPSMDVFGTLNSSQFLPETKVYLHLFLWHTNNECKLHKLLKRCHFFQFHHYNVPQIVDRCLVLWLFRELKCSRMIIFHEDNNEQLFFVKLQITLLNLIF